MYAIMRGFFSCFLFCFVVLWALLLFFLFFIAINTIWINPIPHSINEYLAKKWTIICFVYHNRSVNEYLRKKWTMICFVYRDHSINEYLFKKWPMICFVYRNHNPYFPHLWFTTGTLATVARLVKLVGFLINLFQPITF